MTTNVFNSISYMDISGICLQRSRKQLLVPPPTRLELQTTPYNTYTKYQLDMRRKAEIFKYGTNSTQTNGLTKSQKFAQLVNGAQPYSSEVLEGILNGSVACPSNHDLVNTPTSSCGVPGPLQNIYLDNTIPLYNFVTNVDPYSQLPVQNARQYITNIQTDIAVPNSVVTELFVLYIDNAIPSPNTTFQFTLPLTITASALPILTGAFIYVFYNSTLMTSNDTTGQYVQGTPPIVAEIPVVDATFSATADKYTGYLSVTNMQVYSTPGFILDIKVLLFFKNPPLPTSVIMNPVGSGGLVFQM